MEKSEARLLNIKKALLKYQQGFFIILWTYRLGKFLLSFEAGFIVAFGTAPLSFLSAGFLSAGVFYLTVSGETMEGS